MQKFSEIITYPKLKRYEGLLGKIPVRFPDVYLGIEVEAEGMEGGIMIPGSWQIVEDGSLKVAGMEFITVPIRAKFLEMELRRLFAAIPKADFSPRTSIHVHMNARDLYIAELHRFMLLYMVFEKCLYNFSGNRWTNNFCVPIYETPKNIPSFLSGLATGSLSPHWSKYMGINLLPLYGGDGVNKIGTIEFRHMSGNNSVEHIMDWCNLITCLKFSSKKLDTDTIVKAILTDQTDSVEFIKSVFGDWAHLIHGTPESKTAISACTSKTKFYMYKSDSYPFFANKKKVEDQEPVKIIPDEHWTNVNPEAFIWPSGIAAPTNPFSQPITATISTSVHDDAWLFESLS